MFQEPYVKLQALSLETQTRLSPSSSPFELPKSYFQVSNHYAHQDSKTSDKEATSDQESIIKTSNDTRKEYSLVPVPGPVTQSVIFANAEPSYQSSSSLSSSRPFSENETTQSTTNHVNSTHPSPEKIYFGHQNCRKTNCSIPELSHPISRLCDSIESNESKESTRVEAEVQVEDRCSDKITETSVSLMSDSNNNDATSDQIIRTPNSSNGENHRCDQCGKTFVTRASLKVIYLFSLKFYPLTI